MGVKGDVLLLLDQTRGSQLAAELNRRGIEAVAVGPLHSYANPAYKQTVRDLPIEVGCKSKVAFWSDVCPEVRKCKPFITTACNTGVQPITAR